jgi:hypothetical protein
LTVWDRLQKVQLLSKSVHCSVCDYGIPRKWQYVSNKFCFKLGKNAAETSKMSELAYTKQEMGRRQVFE